MWALTSLLLLDVVLSSQPPPLVRNVTAEIFGDVGNDTEVLPMAFGDFNADKYTDVFVVNRQRTNVKVLLATAGERSLFASAANSGPYFDAGAAEAGHECRVAAEGSVVVSLIPGDFDGDGGMDVVVVTKQVGASDQLFRVVVLWGTQVQLSGSEGTARLDCSMSSNFTCHGEPILVDADGDNVADLFGVNEHDEHGWQLGFWRFNSSARWSPPSFAVASHSSSALASPHGSALVDIDADHNADLFVMLESRIELWMACTSGSAPDCSGFHGPALNLSYPPESSRGLPAFADFNLDGAIDVLWPVCTPEGDSKLYGAKTTDLVAASFDWADHLLPPPAAMYGSHGWGFDCSAAADGDDAADLYRPLTARVGDFDLDGYPELLIRLINKRTKQKQNHLFMNIADDKAKSALGRGFILQTDILSSVPDTVMASFFDLYEDGTLDFLVAGRGGGGGGAADDDQPRVAAFANVTKNSDAYFLKVIVLSGICSANCPGPSEIATPYGTNLPGQMVRYNTTRPLASGGVGGNGRIITAAAAQLTQTAARALQLPYTIFGLGLSPNFIDAMTVFVSDASGAVDPSTGGRSHTWTQIIPNSQVYVVPYPPKQTSKWIMKLFIAASRNILLTGLALIGTCVLATLVIGALHWRDRRQDRREKLQEANRFNFDAM